MRTIDLDLPPEDFYNRTYAAKLTNSKDCWNVGPVDPMVVTAAIRLMRTYYPKQVRVLDIACGVGRNFKPLVGITTVKTPPFKVDAVEKSTVAIRHIKKFSTEHKLDIRTYLGDVMTMSFEKIYDLVILSYMLDKFYENATKELISKMQDATVSGGMHAITTFVQDNKAPRDIYAKKSIEILQMYSGWDLVSADVKPDCEPYRMSPNATGVLHLLVQKP